MGYPTEEDLRKTSRKAKKLFKDDTIKTIIIDEISMVRSDTFYAMSKKLQHIKKNLLPFGGLQVIVIGDFFQTQPVCRRGTTEWDLVHNKFGSLYCFATKVWQELDFEYVFLKTMERVNDPIMKNALMNLRVGKDVKKCVDYFNRNCYNPNKELNLNAVRVVTTNRSADKYNQEKFSENLNPRMVYMATSWGDFKEEPVPRFLELKEGCKVIITANCPNGEFMNGNTGIVTTLGGDCVEVELDTTGETVVVTSNDWENRDYEVNDGELQQVITGGYRQIPIILAYALTVHRLQGATLPELVIDFSQGTFAYGQAYVALSRAVSLEGLQLKAPIQVRDIMVSEEALIFFINLMKNKM